MTAHPREFFQPLANGAPAPFAEPPVKLERMIHFIPPHNAKMVAKLPELIGQVDVVLGNLEDSIPMAEKEAARAGFINLARRFDFGDTGLWTRVNDLRSPWVIDDIQQIVAAVGDKVDVIMVPKIESRDDILFFDRLIAHAEAKFNADAIAAGRPPLARPIMLHAILETAKGVNNVVEIAAASPRMHGLSLGPADLAASMGMMTTRVGGGHPFYRVVADEVAAGAPRPYFQQDLWHGIVSRMVAACRDAGIKPVYGPFGDFKDDVACETQFRNAYILGCRGAWSLYPSQITIAKNVFNPNVDEVRYALRVMEAMPDGTGGAQVDGKFIDDAVWKQCKVFVDLALAVIKKEPQMAEQYFGVGGPQRNASLVAVRQARVDLAGYGL